jgi:hypothetical protein
MSKHESRLKKQYSTTLKETRDMIDSRVEEQEEEIREAMTIRRADKIDGCTTDLQAIGFVFSDDQVEGAIQAEDALNLAKKVVARRRYDNQAGYALNKNAEKDAA